MIRKKIIAGNWKMNKTIPEAMDLIQKLIPLVKKVVDVEIVVCPPFVCLSDVSRLLKNTNICLGAQDLHWEKKGAFTGKISGSMLKSAGADYVIIGHSEQRTYFGETNESVNKKLLSALTEGLKPIVCVGETLQERESNKTESIVRSHIEGAFKGLSKIQAQQCVIAYEPVWAIGTGKTATDDQAQEVHAYIRSLLRDLYDGELAQSVRIQYGGSMKPENAKSLMSREDIDGGLIGGASLEAEAFYKIVNYKGN
jgi:triosephosphate isomerase